MTALGLAAPARTAVVEVRDLTLSYRTGGVSTRVLHGVSFEIGRGEVLGLVGESGCGKSTVGFALLGYRFAAARIEGGCVLFDGRDLLAEPRKALDRLRGDRIGFVPQNPTTALNPAMRVGHQMAETLFLHRRATDKAAARRTAELFELVGLPDPARIGRRYPHELSGGQQQRVCIAMAVACEPELIVLDEPTTGLDVTTQAQIVALLADLRARLGTSMLYVTHDLGVLGQIADRIGVMYAGHLVELAPARVLFAAPAHPYTRGLIGSVPRIELPDGTGRRPLRGLLLRRELPPGCPFAPRCEHARAACALDIQRLQTMAPGHAVACERWREIDAEEPAAPLPAAPRRMGEAAPLLTLDGVTLAYAAVQGPLGRLLGQRGSTVVRDLSLEIRRGETYALVGESGSGKSSVARAISGLLPPVRGTIALDGQELSPHVGDRTPEQRRAIQYIFQNPDASLNPRARIGTILARPAAMFGAAASDAADTASGPARAVAAALADVRLDAGYAARFADELSGGERQRVAIARALIAGPELLLCDEILSALDVSVQANIIELLRGLRAERDVAMLFISHDLSVVRTLANRVGVLYGGVLMEAGPVEAIFAPPFHPYTLTLMEAVPRIGAPVDVGPRAAPEPASARIPGAACPFAGRCRWQLGETCVGEAPPVRRTVEGLTIRCHMPLDELRRLTGAAVPALEAAK